MPVETIIDRPQVEELASRVQETHRRPDPYYFLIDGDGDLFSPSHHLKVKNIIRTEHPVGVSEARACQFISQWANQEWANQERSGAIAWVSPPYPGFYPVSKIIVSEIESVNGAKRLFNRAMVLDIDARACLELGQRLIGFSLHQPFLTSPEDLRATPIVLDTSRNSLVSILARVIVDTRQIEMIRNGKDIITKQVALAQAGRVYLADYDSRSPLIRGVLGDRPESCPPRPISAVGQTAFQIFSSHSLESDSMGSLYFPCPACGATNKRPREGYVELCQNLSCPDRTKVRC